MSRYYKNQSTYIYIGSVQKVCFGQKQPFSVVTWHKASCPLFLHEGAADVVIAASVTVCVTSREAESNIFLIFMVARNLQISTRRVGCRSKCG